MKTSILFSDALWVFFYFTLALGGGLVFNQFLDHPLPLLYVSKADRLKESVARLAPDLKPAPVTQSDSAAQTISLDQFKEFVEKRQGIVLDARPEIFYRLGHVPGAISLPRDSFEEQYPVVRPILEKQPRKPIVVYCTGLACQDSRLVQSSLLGLRYENVAIFLGGWNEWLKAVGTQERAQ